MFDELTRAQLSTLHELLYFVGCGIFAQLFGADCKPRIPTDSIEWSALRVRQAQNGDLMEAVYAELRRRDHEASADHADQIAEHGCCDICGMFASQVRDA